MFDKHFQPTADQTYKILSDTEPLLNFYNVVKQADKMQKSGKVEEACNLRFEAAQHLLEILPEDEEVNLEWGDSNSQAALELLFLSAIDHFLIGDYEISSALLETSLELDPEDHLEATNLLGYNYLALGEYELFDEIVNDISDKHPSRMILLLWSAHLRTGKIDQRELLAFKSRYTPYYEEFTGDNHPADEAYLKDIESDRPSKTAQARELWLQTESLWAQFPDFIQALRNS